MPGVGLALAGDADRRLPVGALPLPGPAAPLESEGTPSAAVAEEAEAEAEAEEAADGAGEADMADLVSGVAPAGRAGGDVASTALRL